MRDGRLGGALCLPELVFGQRGGIFQVGEILGAYQDRGWAPVVGDRDPFLAAGCPAHQ
jgi:hypothetical protein